MSQYEPYYDIPGLQPAPPFNNPDWYHHNGGIDWNREHPNTLESTKMLETYDIFGMDTIDHNNIEAKKAINSSIKYWFDYLKADGARVDASKCMTPSYLNELEKLIGVNTFGENFDVHVGFVKNWAGEKAQWGTLDFPLFQAIVNCFAHEMPLDDTSPYAISLKTIFSLDYLYF